MGNSEQIMTSIPSEMPFSITETPFDWDGLSSEIDKRIKQTSVLASIICTTWNELAVASDYYNMIESSIDSLHYFSPLQTISAFIRNSAEHLETASFLPSNNQLKTLMLDYKKVDLNNNQSSRDAVAEVKRDPSQSPIPFHPQEMYLYRLISRGAEPWEVIQSFSNNLMEAIDISPQYALAVIQATGLDIILPEFPAISTSQLNDLDSIMDRWQTNDELKKRKDGIKFFTEALQEAHVSTQRDDESPVDYVRRIFQLLPSLQRFVRYDLPPEQNQRPEYYMELLRGISYAELQRRLQFGETYRETITALSVRNGKILAVASNPNEDMHAEHLLTAITRQKLGDPKSLLDGVDMYVTIAPCKKKCWPELKELHLNKLYTGPRTTEGIGPLDEMEAAYPVESGLLAEDFTQLYEIELQWDNFLEKTIQNK